MSKTADEDYIRQRVQGLEDEIGGTSKERTKLSIANVGKRVSSPKDGPQRPILSLIRGLDVAMRRLQGYDQLRGFEKLVGEYDKFRHFIEANASAAGVLSDMKAKAVAIAGQTEAIAETTKMLSELKDCSDVLKKELPLNHSEFDTALLRAESLMSIQMQRAAELQAQTEELLESYNTIVGHPTFPCFRMVSDFSLFS